MTSPEPAMDSHFEGVRKRAAVCSKPPSEVGVGMTTSVVFGSRLVVPELGVLVKGRK